MSNEIDFGVTGSDQVRKRAPSRQTSISDLNQNTVSQKSSVSNTFYRYHILDRVRIFVRSETSSMDIQVLTSAIFKHEIPAKRASEISGIAKKFPKVSSINFEGPIERMTWSS